MFIRVCQLFHQLHNFPKSILAIALLLTTIALWLASSLKLESAYSQIMPPNLESVKELKRIEDKFGGRGYLSITITCNHKENCDTTRKNIKSKLFNIENIHFIEAETESDFYKKNKLLYINIDDLKEIKNRVETSFWLAKKRSKPLIVDILTSKEQTDSQNETFDLSDLEKKYFGKLLPHIGYKRWTRSNY